MTVTVAVAVAVEDERRYSHLPDSTARPTSTACQQQRLVRPTLRVVFVANRTRRHDVLGGPLGFGII